MELFGKPPWWADGVCREENKAKNLGSIHCAHSSPFPERAFCKREQQRSIGNLTMGLFWKTRLFISGLVLDPCCSYSKHCGCWRVSLQTGEEHRAPTSWNDFNHFDHRGSIMNVMCSLFDPFASRTKHRGAFEFTGKAYLQYAAESWRIIEQRMRQCYSMFLWLLTLQFHTVLKRT